MKTHTLRWNKTKTQRILTFTPAFVAELEKAHPWAARALIGAMCKELNAHIDMDQKFAVEKSIAQVPETSYEQHKTLGWLAQGHRLLDCDLEDHLRILNFAAGAIFGK